MGPIPVFLVDESPAFLGMLAQFLKECSGDELVVVGTARRGEEALAQVGSLRPRVIILGLMMPGLGGLETLSRLRKMRPDAGIIVLTLADADSYRRTALAAGADAFVSKTTFATDLLPALRRVVQAKAGNQLPGDRERMPVG